MLTALDLGHPASDVSPAVGLRALGGPLRFEPEPRAARVGEDAFGTMRHSRLESEHGLGAHQMSSPLERDIDGISLPRYERDRKLGETLECIAGFGARLANAWLKHIATVPLRPRESGLGAERGEALIRRPLAPTELCEEGP